MKAAYQLRSNMVTTLEAQIMSHVIYIIYQLMHMHAYRQSAQ